jgi:CBS domain containing-hemolysin-like protein
MKSGFSKIPVYEEGFNERFIGFLDTKLLIGTGFQEEDARVGQLGLGSLRTLAPETSLTEALGVFRNREAKIVVVTEGGKSDGQALGILTFRDVVEEAIGKEMEMR